MLAANALEHNPDIGDDELLDVLSSNLCRCTGYQNIIKAVRAGGARIDDARAAEGGGDGERPSRRPAARHDGRPLSDAAAGVRAARARACGDAHRGPAAGHRPRPLRRRHQLSASASHARGALAEGARAGSSRSMPRRRWRCRAWSRSGPTPTSPIFRRSISAPTRTPPASANSASRRWPRPTCATSAIRWRRCSPTIPTSPRTPPSWSTVEIEELPVVMSASDPPGEFEPGRSHAKRSCCTTASATSKRRSATPHAVVEIDVQTGRHSGVPLETRGAIGVYDAAQGPAGAARRREDPAPQSRDALPHAQPQPVVAACAREPCRRRLRHPRRALSRGPAGAGRGDAVRAAGEMDRGPARAPDVRQPGPRAAPPRAHRGRQGRPHPRHRGRDLPRPGRLYPHPRRERPEPHHVHADRLPTRCRPIGRMARVRLTNKTPAATYRAPGRYREHVRALAADGCGRRRSSASIRVEVRRRNLITADEMPYVIAFNEPGVEELEFDSGDYPALLDKALEAFGWDKLQADMKRRRAAGELVGAGLAIFMEESGRGPDRQRQDQGRSRRRGRADHRRRVARAGLRDRDGADLRRGARRRLPDACA